MTLALSDRDQEAKHLETQIQMLQHKYNQSEYYIQMQRNTIDKQQQKLTEEKKAKEHALNRYDIFPVNYVIALVSARIKCLINAISVAAAHKLRDQNPQTTYLSDLSRPLKLAEKVSELYDNEWANAMENLEKLAIQEEKGIKILLKIIKVSSFYIVTRRIQLYEWSYDD